MVDESWLSWLCSISRCALGLGVKTGGAAGEERAWAFKPVMWQR
jgi:hypothetical protein